MYQGIVDAEVKTFNATKVNKLKELSAEWGKMAESAVESIKTDSRKKVEEIKMLLNGYGVEVSTECAKECFDFCQEVIELEDEELTEVAGGVGDASVPDKAKNSCTN